MNRHLLILTLIALTLASCSDQPVPVEMPPPSVGVHEVTRQPLVIHREFIGRTAAPARVEVRARVSGTLERLAFREGSAVTAGQVLFEIERQSYEAREAQVAAQVESAQAQLAEAEARLGRLEQLAVNRSVSAQDVDEARAAVQVAGAAVKGGQAALRQAQLDLEYARILSPINGRIGESRVDAGNLVGPETGVLATVIQLDPIRVHFTLSDVEYLEFRRRQTQGPANGDAAGGIAPTLRLADRTDYPHEGRLELIGNEIDPGTGTITVRAEFPNPDQLLRPGQFVTVVFDGDAEGDVVSVPQAAVLTTQAGRSVMVVGDDGTVRQRVVEIGEQSGKAWVVTSGLEAGERIVLTGLQRVRDGMTVNVVDR